MGAYDDWDTVQNGIEVALKDIDRLRKTDSRYDTVKAIHDYICDNLSFYEDYASKGSYGQYAGEQGAASPLFGGGSIGKKNVCEGYSMTCKLQCDRFGIPSAVISSNSHAFNYIMMDDGRYYLVDCLWDDQNPTEYTYFLIGKNTILSWIAESALTVTSEFDHVENWYFIYDGMDHEPFVYPVLSEQAFSLIEPGDDVPPPKSEVSGTVTFSFRCMGQNPPEQTARVYWDNHKIATVPVDETGAFSFKYDTTLLYGSASIF